MKMPTWPSCINKIFRPWNSAQCLKRLRCSEFSCEAIQSHWPICPGDGGPGKRAVSLLEEQQRETHGCPAHVMVPICLVLLVSGSSSWCAFVLGPQTVPLSHCLSLLCLWVKLFARKGTCPACALSTDCFLTHCRRAREGIVPPFSVSRIQPFGHLN